jgi:putative FmdB family regulatory protein
MPLYEYRCKGCNKIFEVLQKIDAEPLSECIHCGEPVEKLVSVSSFQFKGSGWYITDYKNKRSGGNGESKAKHHTVDKDTDNGKKEKSKNKNVTQK